MEWHVLLVALCSLIIVHVEAIVLQHYFTLCGGIGVAEGVVKVLADDNYIIKDNTRTKSDVSVYDYFLSQG